MVLGYDVSNCLHYAVHVENPISALKVTQGHRYWYHSIEDIRHPIVTMTLSSTVSEIRRSEGRNSRFFAHPRVTPPLFDAPVGCFRRKFFTPFRTHERKWMCYHMPLTSWRYLFPPFHSTGRSDAQVPAKRGTLNTHPSHARPSQFGPTPLILGWLCPCQPTTNNNHKVYCVLPHYTQWLRCIR